MITKKPHFRDGNVRWRNFCFCRAAHSIQHVIDNTVKTKNGRKNGRNTLSGINNIAPKILPNGRGRDLYDSPSVQAPCRALTVLSAT
jgi:hypothetical protein